MIKLKLAPIPDDKPVKLTVEVPAELHRDLIAYGEILGREAGQGPIEPKKLVVPMLERPARALYAAHGYTERARRPIFKGGWDGPGDDWILLTKPL